jgi:hypothetical protein
MMKCSLFFVLLTIWCLEIGSNLTHTTVDLQLAIDRFFKTGILEESWFSVKELKDPGKFDEFRKQALDARNIAFTLFGAYKRVRSQSNTSYIATFDRRELGIEFQLDSLGRITAISTK